MSMTEDLGDFVTSFSLQSAPAELLPKARQAVLDSFGVMLAGSREESAQLAARWVQSQGATGPCSVIAQKGFQTSAANAALANGVAAHTLDYDHFGHQSAVMVPTLLAAGEARAVDAVIKIAERHQVKPQEVTEISCAAAPNTHVPFSRPDPLRF